jgi:hypothetical protein
MENENNAETDNRKNDIWKTYQVLAEARASGDVSYHTLVNVYALLHSIMVTALSILATQGSHSYPLMLLVSVIAVAGMFLCLQTCFAQRLYTQKNAFFGWNLRKIEQENELPGQIFTKLCQLRKRHIPIEGNEAKCCKCEQFTTNLASRNHEKWWASRLKTFPWVFGSIYLCFVFYSASDAISQLYKIVMRIIN